MKSLIKYCLLFVVVSVRAQGIVKSNKKDYNSKPITHTEAYAGIASGYRALVGINRVTDLSERISVVYGVSYSNYYYNLPNIESGKVWNNYSLNIPLELRYYILPKGNRLTAFLYCKLNNSFYNHANYQPNAEIGVAIQYKISEKSSIFFKAGYSPNFFNPSRPFR